MAANAFDRIKSAASGAAVIGTAVAARAARTAGPLVDRVIGALRSRMPGSATESSEPSRGTDPVTVTPDPALPAPEQASPTPAAPTPAAVAKNIPPHPPEPAAKNKLPAKKPAPGAKLPPRRKDTGS